MASPLDREVEQQTRELLHMLMTVATRMFLHERGKYFSVVLGVAMALFLVLLQSGFYFGFLRDITIVADSFDADLWISQRELLAFDYVAHFDDLPRWQALADVDVAAAMPVVSSNSNVTAGISWR